MSRRIDIELTSRREDESWTWRASGAREPRGSLDGALLPAGAAVGDVLRADAEFGIDGILITAVQPAKEKDAREDERPDRIEVLGSGREPSPGVSVSLAPGSRRRDERGTRGERPERPERRERPERPDRMGRPDADARVRGGGRAAEERGAASRPRTARREQPDDGLGSRDSRTGPPFGRDVQKARGTRARPASGREASKERKDRRRPEPVSTNRNSALAALRPEQLPVAEQLLRGGIPAVRRAIDEQNERARNEGRAEIAAEPLMAMAEELLPVMNLAAWKDRAVAVRNAGRDAPLREVRSVVSAASAVTLDEEGRSMLSTMRESLDQRVTALRESWLERITTALEAGRVADALRVSGHPPEPGARLPGELAVRMTEAAGQAMAPDLARERWTELLEAVIESPVRRRVKPAGLPTDADDELLRSARRAAGYVPELARLLGLPIPPPPGPRKPAAAAGRRI